MEKFEPEKSEAMKMQNSSHPTSETQAQPGSNLWNQVEEEPQDWWEAIRRIHGHVGPWNVLGWRIGRAALRELQSGWGRHEVELVCYVPLQTPYTCLADGLMVATGNSLGRLDLRMAEAVVPALIQVVARRKDGQGSVWVFRPLPDYLRSIRGRPVSELESLARFTADAPEEKLFTKQAIPPE